MRLIHFESLEEDKLHLLQVQGMLSLGEGMRDASIIFDVDASLARY